jgi:hypothetical protein
MTRKEILVRPHLALTNILQFGLFLRRDLLRYLCDLRFRETQVIELLGCEDPFNREQRQHLRAQIRSWLNNLQRLRIKPNNPTGSFKFYSDLLFDYPLVGLSSRICGY